MTTSLSVLTRVRTPGGLISAIAPESLASELDLVPGDRLMAINGHLLRDVIDYRFYGADEQLEIVGIRDGIEKTYHVSRDYDRELGFEFDDVLFTSIRRCANTCDFCFVDQNPIGLRSSLYIPDDDYRLSFLFGDFITLTNLKETDWRRIEEQRLSPLYVSVHATDLELRRRLLGNTRALDIRDELRRLELIGVQVHCQIVLCPGVNDGERLDRTVNELMDMYPLVQTVAVVPVGLTKFSPASHLRSLTKAEARVLIAQAKRWTKRYRATLGFNPVFLSDEVYLLAAAPLPSSSYYSGCPQYENGIGMVRGFQDDLGRLERRLAKHGVPPQRRPAKITAVCGRLAAPTLQKAAEVVETFGHVRMHVTEITNDFLGEQVTCSGLLAGRDIVRQLAGRDLGEFVLLPRRALNQRGELFIDDTSFDDVVRTLGVPIRTGNDVVDIADTLGLSTSRRN